MCDSIMLFLWNEANIKNDLFYFERVTTLSCSDVFVFSVFFVLKTQRDQVGSPV